MRILYAVQGTGNGHVARARHVVPLLQKHAEVDVWISGTESQVDLPVSPSRVFSGISLKYNLNGGLSYWRCVLDNPWPSFIWDVLTCPVRSYDLVVNDFEPVSAWAVALRGGRILEVSHQAGVRHSHSPRPKKRHTLGEWILRNYAPARESIGFHVQGCAPDVYPPLIRHEIRFAEQKPGVHLLVYLPAYGIDQLVSAFSTCSVPVKAFTARVAQREVHGALTLEPVDAMAFLSAFCAAHSVLCGAGFELPTEALFHGKRLAVIPIEGQYEQACNAAALRLAGAWTARSLKHFKCEKWLQSPPPQATNWPDYSDELTARILAYAQQPKSPQPVWASR